MLFTIYFYIFMFTKISEKNHKQKTRIKFILISSINYTQNFLGGPQGCFFSVSAIY